MKTLATLATTTAIAVGAPAMAVPVPNDAFG